MNDLTYLRYLIRESLLQEGRGDIMFIKLWNRIVQWTADSGVFEWKQGDPSDRYHHAGSPWKFSSKKWAMPYYRHSTTAAGGIFKNSGRLKTVVTAFYDQMVEKYGDVAKNHYGSDPTFLYAFIQKIALWAYVQPGPGTLGAMSGEIAKSSASSGYGTDYSDEKHPRIKFASLPGNANLSINFKHPAAARASNQVAWSDSLRAKLTNTPPHEFRHAYQNIFVVPNKMKKGFDDQKSSNAAAKEVFELQQGRRIELAKGAPLKKGWSNMLKKIFGAQNQEKWTVGKRKPVTYDAERGFAVVITRDIAGKSDPDQRRVQVMEYIVTKIYQLAEEGDKEASRIFKSITRAWQQDHEQRGGPEALTGSGFERENVPAADIGHLKGTSVRAQKLTPKERKAKGIKSKYDIRTKVDKPGWQGGWGGTMEAQLPLDVIEDNSTLSKKIARANGGGRIMFIVTAPEVSVRFKGTSGKSYIGKKKTRMAHGRNPEFRQFRGKDWVSQMKNLGGKNPNSDKKWANQPTEYDAEFLATFAENFAKMVPRHGPFYHAMGTNFEKKMVQTILPLMLSNDAVGLQKALRDQINLRRFLQNWGTPADEKEKKMYEKGAQQRVRAIAQEMINWAQDSWPMDPDSAKAARWILDPESAGSPLDRRRGSWWRGAEGINDGQHRQQFDIHKLSRQIDGPAKALSKNIARMLSDIFGY